MSPFGLITISILPHHLHSLKFIYVSNIVGHNGYGGNWERHLIDSRCWMSEEFVLHLIKHDSKEYEWNPWRINQIIVWIWCRWQFLTFFPGDYPNNFVPDWTNTNRGGTQGVGGGLILLRRRRSSGHQLPAHFIFQLAIQTWAMGDLNMLTSDNSHWIKFSKRCSYW